MKKSPQTLILASLALGATLLLGACGLETYLYLEAPNYYSSTGTVLSFGHSTTNTNPNFLGYEVYYRLYPGNSNTAPSSASSDISAISSSISAASGADQVVALLKTKKFRRMGQSAVTPVISPGNPPFTAIPAGLTGTAGIITTIDLGDGTAVTSVVGSSLYCARSVLASDLSYRPFTDAWYDEFDCDTSNSTTDYIDYLNKMTHPYLVAYAFAYALQSDFTATYSYPTLLNSSGSPTDISGIAN